MVLTVGTAAFLIAVMKHAMGVSRYSYMYMRIQLGILECEQTWLGGICSGRPRARFRKIRPAATGSNCFSLKRAGWILVRQILLKQSLLQSFRRAKTTLIRAQG